MKFYFCEGCGKRITEKDIAGGDARDKKLRGMFCTDCSEGVMTMESLPMNEEQAKQVLSETADHAVAEKAPPEQENLPPSGVMSPQSGVQRATRRSGTMRAARRNSSGDIATATRQPRHTGQHGRIVPGARGAEARPGSGGGAGMGLWLGLGGMALLLVVGAFMLFSGGGTPRNTTGDTKPQSVDKPPAATPVPAAPARAEPRPVASSSAPSGVDKSAAAPPADSGPTEATAQDAFEKLTAFTGIAADDTAAKVAAIDAYLQQYGSFIVASRARRLKDKLVNPQPATPPAATPAAQPVTPSTPVALADIPAPSGDAPAADGFKPFVSVNFENMDLDNVKGDGSKIDIVDIGGKKVVRAYTVNRDGWSRLYRGLHGGVANTRVRFRYYAHNCSGIQVLFATNPTRYRNNIKGFKEGEWTWGVMTAAELKAGGTFRHIEIGGKAKGQDAFLLIDELHYERK